MTKQERIKDAYGEYWDRVKGFVDKNGWTEYPKLGSSKLLIDFGGEYGAMPDQFFCRPSSLKGIEDNNGWIKIESEKDLPKQDVDVHLMLSLFNGKHGLFYTIGLWDNELKAFFSGRSKLTKVTHYQPIQRPEFPLF